MADTSAKKLRCSDVGQNMMGRKRQRLLDNKMLIDVFADHSDVEQIAKEVLKKMEGSY